jgi:hypothetical protein
MAITQAESAPARNASLARGFTLPRLAPATPKPAVSRQLPLPFTGPGTASPQIYPRGCPTNGPLILPTLQDPPLPRAGLPQLPPIENLLLGSAGLPPLPRDSLPATTSPPPSIRSAEVSNHLVEPTAHRATTGHQRMTAPAPLKPTYQQGNGQLNKSAPERRKRGPYSCPYPGCGKEFGRVVIMDKHIDTKHQGEDVPSSLLQYMN